MTTPPGWYHAEGDPPGTQRYWNGSEWQGEPQQASAPAQPVAPPAAPAAPPGPSFAAPPGPAFAPPSQPAKKSNALKWVLAILLLIVLGIGGCTFAFWRAVSGPIDASNDFLNAVQAEDFDRAWALSDPLCFPGSGPDDLAATFTGFSIESYNLSSSSVSNNSGESSGRLTLVGGDERSVTVFVNQRDGDWLVCGFDIGARGS